MPPKLPADQRYVPVEPTAPVLAPGGPAPSPPAPEPFPEAATDLQSVLRLVNAMRDVLIKLGPAREE